MKGLVALITGGASGLGKGTVETLINHGLKVVIVDLPSSDGAEVAKYYGENCIFIPANVCIFLILILLYCVKFDFNFNEPIRILRERSPFLVRIAPLACRATGKYVRQSFGVRSAYEHSNLFVTM